MQPWSSQPWAGSRHSGTPPVDPTEVTRAVLEVIHELSLLVVNVDRSVLEILAPVGYTLPTSQNVVSRAAAEVLGLATEFATRRGELARVSLEVLGSVMGNYKGLNVPPLAVNAVSVAYAATLDYSGPGSLGITDQEGYGYYLEWASASPTTIQERWKTPFGTYSLSFPAPAGRFVRAFARSAGVGGVNLTSVAGVRHPDLPKAGVLHEIIVWNREISDADRVQVQDYLRCKWLPDECAGLNFYEFFDNGLTPYTYSRIDGEEPTPLDRSTFQMTDGSPDNPRLNVYMVAGAYHTRVVRSMPAQEYRELSVRFTVIAAGLAAAEMHVSGTALGIVIRPRGTAVGNRPQLALSASFISVGSGPLTLGALYEFRIVRRPTGSIGDWSIIRLDAPSGVDPVHSSGSATVSWEWSGLGFYGGQNPPLIESDAGQIVAFDNIEALGVLPEPP